MNRDLPLVASVGEGGLQRDGQAGAGGQIKELVVFPAIESLVLHLDVAIVLRPEDAVGVGQAHHQLKALLIIQTTLADQAQQVNKLLADLNRDITHLRQECQAGLSYRSGVLAPHFSLKISNTCLSFLPHVPLYLVMQSSHLAGLKGIGNRFLAGLFCCLD